MADLVQTTKGMVPFGELEVRDVIEVGDNSRVTATEWFLKGEMVRRDVHVNILRGLELAPSQGKVG